MKKQYEHWLIEKDKALSGKSWFLYISCVVLPLTSTGFVEAFNTYRTKKAEQLRLAEHEIVRLYEYTEKIEKILEDVEKGKFQVN